LESESYLGVSETEQSSWTSAEHPEWPRCTSPPLKTTTGPSRCY